MKHLFPALFILCTALASAQSLQPDELDYYLQQALTAKSASDRHALNHIGIQGRSEAQGYRVTAVLETYPAQLAGLYRGDLILSAGGDPFHPVFSFNESSNAPANFAPRPDTVLLTIRRGYSELELSVRPVFENLFDSYRSASLRSVQQFPSGNKTIGYLRLWLLSRNSNDLISYQQLFRELQGTDGIILDVRDATGFLDREHLRLVYRGDSNLFAGFSADSSLAISTRLTAASDAYRNPVALLVNDRTRAGAELFAYQLDKSSRVITLGETTAGQIGAWQALANQRADEPVLNYVPGHSQIDGESFEGTGHAPESIQAYPVTQPGRIDPQFQAAMDMLMGII